MSRRPLLDEPAPALLDQMGRPPGRLAGAQPHMTTTTTPRPTAKRSGHAIGTHLGGVRSIACVRERCVLPDGDAGCWHLRTPRGRPLPRGGYSQRIWVHGRGQVSAPRAVWEFAHGRSMPSGRRAVRTCGSYDCANPAHIRSMTHSDAQKHIVGKWPDMTPARRSALDALNLRKRRFSNEQVAEIRMGTASASSLARRWGCSVTSVLDVRHGKTYRGAARSVFDLAAAA